MTKVSEIFGYLCELAPLELQMSFDNAGLLLGRSGAEVSRVLLSLDVTTDVIREAVDKKAELIVSHHPLFLEARKTITDGDPDGEKLLLLAENRLAVISMHTNLDIASGGVNDVLLGLFGAIPEGALDADGCGRIGRLPAPAALETFLPFCKDLLHTAGLRYYDAGKPVHRLAVMGGSGGGSIQRAYELGCDTYLTSDIKYHQFLLAKELGINLIDGDHFCTEAPVMKMLAKSLSARFPDLSVLMTEVHGQTARFA